ncbi:MAG: conjugal transfer protein TraF [Holophagales bacterium]|nr:conjugal transfer protein TraF [Holophagales bacterium]
MNRSRRIFLTTVVLAAAAFLFAAAPAAAQMPFAPFGARQVAMGGASVGLGDDPASFVDNPALLTPTAKAGAAAYGDLATESGGFVGLLEGVTGYDPVELARPGNPDAASVRANLLALSAPGTSVLGDGRSAIASSIGGWGIFIGSTKWSAAVARPDLVHVEAGADPATSFAYNDSVVAFRALTVQDYAVSRAFPFFNGNFVVGVTGRYSRGTTGIKEESAFTTDIGNLSNFVRRGRTGNERTKSRYSYDVGAVINIGALRLGGVMKGVNRPQYPFNDDAAPEVDRGTSVVVGQQSRVGASFKIQSLRMRIAADLDLTKNETLAAGQLSRNAGGGVEFFFGAVDLRGGVTVNLEAPDNPYVYTFGLGLGNAKAKLDVAAIYRSNDGAYGGVLTTRVGF